MGTPARFGARQRPRKGIGRYLPVLEWLPRYGRDDLAGDLLAGLIVAIMLVPQSMAYALLAGLPPQTGLYASLLPLILYGLLGTSKTLAVGPVAIISLLVASGAAPLAEAGSAAYVQVALTLALLAGLIQLAMGLLRVGFLVNFLSHPVLAGFTSAAAIVIGFSQVKHLLGIQIPNYEFLYQSVWFAATHLQETQVVTLLIGLGSVGLLLFFKYRLGDYLARWRIPEKVATPLAKSAPLFVVVTGTALVVIFRLDQIAGVRTVGAVPAGLPSLTMPSLDPAIWRALLPTALAISFVGYMESISVSKSLASKRRQKVDSDQELIALGVADLGAAFTGGYPVTGGFSRSVVNFSAGANSALASIVTAALVAVTLLLFTPLFSYLPTAVLAAIILVAVLGLIDLGALRYTWRYSKADGVSYLITFMVVLAVGIEAGIVAGVGTALALFIWRTSKPHVAVVGRLGDSEIYRNVLRHEVQTCPRVVAIRIDESLYFANSRVLEDSVLSMAAEEPLVDFVILIGTAINAIDASALETLESLHMELSDAGVALHFAAIKGPVMDRLRHIGFVQRVGDERFHESTHEAMLAVGCAGTLTQAELAAPQVNATAWESPSAD